MFYIVDYMIVFQEECVETGGASNADRRAGQGTRGARDKGRFPVGRSWVDIMDEEKKN